MTIRRIGVVTDERGVIDGGGRVTYSRQRLRHVGRRASAVAGDDRGHAHVDEVRRGRVIREVVGMRVDVDEARRHDEIASVDASRAPAMPQSVPIAAMRPSLIARSARMAALARCRRRRGRRRSRCRSGRALRGANARSVAIRTPFASRSSWVTQSRRVVNQRLVPARALASSAAVGFVKALTASPTTTTTSTPMGLCQR